MIQNISGPSAPPSSSASIEPGLGSSATVKTAPVPLPASTSAAAAASTAQPTADVSISAEGQEMQKLAEGLRQRPVNEQKVAAIRQAIAQNTYRIDPESIAEKMIQFEQSGA